MNKSKFLKRSLAALLAILMVATMIPSAFAAGEDAPEIFVDNRRATCDGTNYSITIYDTDDVLISWTPIPGTKMRVVTKDGIEKDLDARIYLPENAAFDGKDTYTIKLQEIVGKNAPIDHNLSITIKSTKPTNECRLGGVRVDKTSGKYKLGYLGDGANDVLGYSNKVEDDGIEAHAIEGVVSGNTVTVTLPFGMTPGDVGFDGAGIANDITATAVFAPMSVVAKSHYTYDPTTKTGSVRVTAQSGATKTYTVKFVSEKVFNSFAGASNLKDLENVTKIKTYASTTGTDGNGAKYTLNVTKEVADPTTTTATTWTPVYEATERLQRLMGAGYAAEDEELIKPKLSVGTTTKSYERISNAVSLDGANTGAMLRLITSGHATWNLGDTAFTDSDSDYVYLLVRTKANPSGAFIEVKLDPVKAPVVGPRITEIQAANTMSNESAAFVAADATSIDVVLDKEYGNDAGGSETDGDNTDISKVYLHVSTDTNAYVRIPSQEANNPAVSSSSWDNQTPDTRHLLKNVNAKDGSVTIQITDANGKNPRNYRVNFRVATTNKTELERVALYTADGVKVAEAIKQADKTAPRELEVPYEYFPTAGDVSQNPTSAVASSSPLANLYLCIFPSEGAAVAPGATATEVNVTNVEVEGSANHSHTTPSGADPALSGNDPHIFENGVTTVGDVWNATFGTGTDFDDTLSVTVSNAGAGTTDETYQIVLKRKLPKTEAELEVVETNKALDADYVYSQANTLGKENSQRDIGQAYVAAMGEDGNELPARISGNDIIVTVPADWDQSTDALYLTKLAGTSDTKELYRYVDDDISATATTAKVASASVLVGTEQQDQTENDASSRSYIGDVNRFINLTEVNGGVDKQNVIYAVSERDYWEQNFAANLATKLKTYSTPYEVHIEYAPDNSEERELKNVTTANPALATVNFDAEYGLITISVPDSTDWSDGYRGDRSKNFKLNFEASADALIIDKYQKELNDVTAGSGPVNGAGNANGRYNGATPAQQNEYWQQLNVRDQITNDTEFFVLNGELYIYDPLTGYETPVTGVGGKFTNNNWATIKSKQAEIQVYDAQQNDKITYRLDLKVGSSQPVSGDNTLSSVTADGHAATKSGNDYTVYVPEGTDMSKAKLSLLTTDSGARVTSVDGKTYTDGMEVDLSEGKTVSVVVTAANGASATYTIKSAYGSAPDPWTNPFTDVKEGDWYYNAVKYVNQNGLMDGTSATKFSPRVNLTRAQFAQILYNAEGNPDVTWTDKFSDVKEGAWYAKAVIWAAENNVLAGYANGTARPNSIVTREDLVSLLWRYAGKPAPTGTTLDFSDASKVSSYAKDALLWAVENKIISGRANGELDPKGNAQRAEAAQMLMQYFSNK